MKLSPVATYLQTRAVTGPWRIAGCAEHDFAGAVVIPALAESERLFATLASLAANPPELLARFLVLVVVNHREDAPLADQEDNRRTLARLAEGSPELAPLKLAWIDAASAGLAMPAKGGGVGLARKIALDLALTRLDHRAAQSLLVCLDADTLVEPTYFPAIIRHFRGTAAGGAVIPFRHQPAQSPPDQRAIDRYELFLRHYVLGLKIAGSPYAFHTVGSAMACTAAAYVKAGGMNSRAAGEDFYFLQNLCRTAGVDQLRGTVVHPSPRPSHRVPFGTGRSISRALAGDAGAIMFYHPECFRLLGEWLALATPGREAGSIMAAALAVSPHLAEYLESADFIGVWEKLRRNHRAAPALRSAFHGWFDGLKTMKLIHHLSAGPFPRCEPEETLPLLLEQARLEPKNSASGQLALLREMQNGSDEHFTTQMLPIVGNV